MTLTTVLGGLLWPAYKVLKWCFQMSRILVMLLVSWVVVFGLTFSFLFWQRFGAPLGVSGVSFARRKRRSLEGVLLISDHTSDQREAEVPIQAYLGPPTPLTRNTRSDFEMRRLRSATAPL